MPHHQPNPEMNKFLYLLIASVILLQACTLPKQEQKERASIDTTKYVRVDSVRDIRYKVLEDTVLKITADSVRALYYPNTGRKVMTLRKGDVCKITRTGRYDVIDNKGNFWIRVERMGGKGWIWGGNTSIESDLWVFEDGMAEISHPYMTYDINKVTASGFQALFEGIGKKVKRIESSDNVGEAEIFKVSVANNEILTTDDNGVGTLTTERFAPGPALDSVSTITYSSKTEATNPVEFNHTFVAYQSGTKNSLVLDFVGELKEIHRSGGNYVFISDYTLTSGELGKLHFTNITVWHPKRKVIKKQRVGYSAVDPTGRSIFKSLEDHSFMAMAEAKFMTDGGSLKMEIFETYNMRMPDKSINEKVFFITRYFNFNPATNGFEEWKQEVIYQAK